MTPKEIEVIKDVIKSLTKQVPDDVLIDSDKIKKAWEILDKHESEKYISTDVVTEYSEYLLWSCKRNLPFIPIEAFNFRGKTKHL